MQFTRLAMAVLVAASALNVPAHALTLVKDGRPMAVIAVPSEPNEHESLALTELTNHVARMSGAQLETANVDAKDVAAFVAKIRAADKVPVLLGRNAHDRLASALPNPTVRGAFALKVDADTVMIAGEDEGTTYGVLELLEQLGCRWFMPGPLGTVVPEAATVEVAEQQTVQQPSFPSRWFQMPHREWQKRVRCGGDVFKGGHGIPAPKAKLNKETGEIEPAEYAEMFALYKGKRTTRQHCLSNPKLVEYAVNAIKARRKAGGDPVIACGPNDGAGFCECDACRALDAGDFDPFSNEPSVTDRCIWFYNRVLDGVLPEYPDTKLAFYIYHTYMRPPVREMPHPAIQGALAPIALDRVHGFSNPVAPEKSYAKWLFQEWGKIMPELYDRGYWSNLACPGFTFIIVDRLRDEIPACHELGVCGWRVETFPNYGPQFPSMYVAGKLMWDHTVDVDALLQDCFDKFFGPAAEPMGEYVLLMDAALRDADHCTGSAWDMPHFYPPDVREQARKLIKKGLKQAKGEGLYEDRARMIGETFDMLEYFIAMMDARVRVDFPAAKAELEKLDAVAEKLMAYKPVPMVSAGRFSTYKNYMRRFFRSCTEGGYARVTGGNRLVAAAQDEWQFQIDPLGTGVDIGLWRADITGGNWQTLKTSSSSWSNQGLRYYKGLAWYRQTVRIDPSFEGQRIFFWCGGVDESAKVWINGQVVGISHGASMYPFELDATDAVQPGENVIVVCVNNMVVNELGTGGILAPVILYAPATGAEAKLENVRDLKPTFP